MVIPALLFGCDKGAESGPGPEPTETETETEPESETETDTETETETEPWPVTYPAGCHPLGASDDCLLPFPSLFWTTPDPTSATGVRLAWSADDLTGGDPLPVDPAMFSTFDGVSPVSPLLARFGVDLDPAFLSPAGEQGATQSADAPILLLDVDTGARVPILTEMDQTNRELGYEGRHPLIVRPLAPMAFGGHYAVLIRDTVRTVDGEPLPEVSAFVALRDAHPTDDATVEEMRPRFEAVFETAASIGVPRASIAYAWDLQVASETAVLGPVRWMRDAAFAEGAAVPFTVTSVDVDPDPHVSRLIRGTFAPPSFLADDVLVLDADGQPIEQAERPTYPFTMVVPPSAVGASDVPLVVIGHGLFMTGEAMLVGDTAGALMYPMADELGAVLVATDWIGLSGNDYALILHEILGDLARIPVVTDRLVQSHANQTSLVELSLGGAVFTDATVGLVDPPALAPDRVWYYGISLGGIQGASFVSISPRVSRAVLAVPGAGWSHMIQRSTQFAPLELLTDTLYPDPLSQNVFLAAVQSYFDRSDPANLGTLLAGDPTLPDAPERVVVLQEAIGDCQVPNLATDLLSRTIGAGHLVEATDPVDGLPWLKEPSLGPALTQIRVPDALKAYTPPTTNTLPTTDNGVHNSAVLQDATFQQARTLFLTGAVVHPCDGPCDPQ